MSIKSSSWLVVVTGLAVLCVIIGIFITRSDKGGHATFVQKSGGSTEKHFFLPTEDDIIDDVDTGLKIIKDVINITFSKTTSDSTMHKIIDSVGGEIVGYDKAVNLYQLRIANTDLATLDNIRTRLLSDFKEVELASRCSVSVHENQYYVK